MAHGPNQPWLSVEQLNARVEELARIKAELLAACKLALDALDYVGDCNACDFLRAAIGHAEGQP